MTFGSTTILSNSRAVGGPDIVSGQVDGVIGDTSLSIDLSSYISNIKSTHVIVNGVLPNATIIDFTTTPGTIDITIPDNGYQVVHLGTGDMSSGFDWGSTPQTFTISWDGGTVTDVDLDTLTTDQATTVTEIDSSLTTAGFGANLEAYTTGNFVGIRTVASTSGLTFAIGAGTPSALGTLGWTAETYTNVDPISVLFTSIG